MVAYGFFYNDAAPTDIYTLSLHDALPISGWPVASGELSDSLTSSLFNLVPAKRLDLNANTRAPREPRSEEHTSELQSRRDLVCRLLLEKKKHYYVEHGASSIGGGTGWAAI